MAYNISKYFIYFILFDYILMSPNWDSTPIQEPLYSILTLLLSYITTRFILRQGQQIKSKSPKNTEKKWKFMFHWSF